MQFVWRPYTELDDRTLSHVPAGLAESAYMMGRTEVPMICFEIVEWQRPDRVTRQFGFRQPIPRNIPDEIRDDIITLRQYDLQGKYQWKWLEKLLPYTGLWDRRHEFIVGGITIGSERLYRYVTHLVSLFKS